MIVDDATPSTARARPRRPPDEIKIGTTTYGDTLSVAREYRGSLPLDERERLVANAIHRAREAVLYDGHDCTGEDCTPDAHDPSRNLQREFIDLVCLTLNFGMFPTGVAEVIREVGNEAKVDPARVDEVIREIDAYLDAYRAQTAAKSPGAAALLPVLPDEFWNARPAFEQVRDAARSRLIAPDGVLAAVLMRVAAMTDFRIALPDIVGRFGSLNSAAVLVAPSGGGKGSALDTARDLIPQAPLTLSRFKEAPVGSGEGMVRAYFEQAKETGDDGKTHTEWRQRYDGVAFRIDEGEMLKGLAERSGQTTMTLIRSAWSGEQLGNSYADRDRRGFILPPHTYRASLIMGVQPEHAGFLLDDAAGGTPQRFLWSALVDPTAPDLDQIPAWPGPLAWQPPDWRDGDPMSIGGYERTTMRVAPTIVAAIRQRRHDITIGRARPDPLDAHAELVQLKVAGLLAILDGRLDVKDDDWRLAAIVCEISRRVRAWVATTLGQVAEIAEAGSIQRSTRRAVAVEAAKANTPRQVERVAEVIARRANEATSDGLTSGALRRAVAGRDRDLFDAALANAIERGLMVESDGRYRAASLSVS